MATTLLSVEGLSKTFGVDEIFRDVTFQIQEREHVALVGTNGAGKSTLLRILAQFDQADTGRTVHHRDLTITYLAQEATFESSQTIREVALSAFDHTREIGQRLEDLEHQLSNADSDQLDAIMSEYSGLRERFEHAGGYDIDHRTDQVLTGLGFPKTEWTTPANQLSGGQKTRLALARALLGDPDLLLLDEPTNHLDLETLEWLENFLRSWRGVFLVVSHDRYFLDRVTDRTLDLNFGQLEDYPAPYGRYLKLREERRARQQAEYEAQQEYIQRTEEFIRKYKAGQRSKEARGRETRLARLERIQAPQTQEKVNFRLPSAERSSRTVLTVKNLEVGFKSVRPPQETVSLIKTPELTIERGDRIALIGPNGGGKTTFLRTILDEIPPLSGWIQPGTSVRMGYYAQGHEGLDLNRTVVDTLLQARPMSEEQARTMLGRFLFTEDDVFKRVSALSGGERSRLALACLTLNFGNFLILDEPTNHLDITSREVLESVLQEYDGTLLFVSHDRYFVDKIATHVWAIHDNMIEPFLGNYSDYMRMRDKVGTLASTPAASTNSSTKAAREPSEPHTSNHHDKKPTRVSDRDIRRMQAELSAAERQVSQLEEKLIELSDALAQATSDQDVTAITSTGEEYEATERKLEEAYATWEELGSKLNEQLESVRRT